MNVKTLTKSIAKLSMAIAIGVSAMATASSAATVVLDFEDLVLATGQDFLAGFYTSQGFQMTNNNLFFGTDTRATIYANSGSTALAMAGPNNTLTLRKVDLSAFSISSIDLLPLGAGPGATVTFTGMLVGGGTVSSTSAAVVSSGLITHSFDSSFTNLASLQWSQTSPFHSFDNIMLDVAAVPLPAGGLLLLSGLGGIAALRRRKNRAA